MKTAAPPINPTDSPLRWAQDPDRWPKAEGEERAKFERLYRQNPHLAELRFKRAEYEDAEGGDAGRGIHGLDRGS